jgi:hypothetical protein
MPVKLTYGSFADIFQEKYPDFILWITGVAGGFGHAAKIHHPAPWPSPVAKWFIKEWGKMKMDGPGGPVIFDKNPSPET